MSKTKRVMFVSSVEGDRWSDGAGVSECRKRREADYMRPLQEGMAQMKEILRAVFRDTVLYRG